MIADANIDVFADRLQHAPDAGLKLLASAAAAVRDDRPLPNEDLAGLFLDDEAPMDLASGADAALARIVHTPEPFDYTEARDRFDALMAGRLDAARGPDVAEAQA